MLLSTTILGALTSPKPVATTVTFTSSFIPGSITVPITIVAEFEAKQVTNPQMALDGFLHAMEMWYSLGLPGLTDKAKEELAEHFELPDKLPSVW